MKRFVQAVQSRRATQVQNSTCRETDQRAPLAIIPQQTPAQWSMTHATLSSNDFGLVVSIWS